MGAFLVALALNQSDLYFLELLGDEVEVGHYAAASTVAHVVTVIQVTLVSLVAPLAGPALEDGADASRATFRRGISWMLGLSLPLSLLLVFLGEPVLALFGAQYRVGHGVLQLLVVGNLGWALAALSALWLQYRGRAKVVLVVSVAALAVDSALNLLLIPRFGMVGAAAGTAATLLGGAVAVVAAHVRAPRPQAAARVAQG
jgi:O-antigen/teichoic acid export membrane protein